MRELHKKVELFANIAIIVVAILLGVVLVQRYLLPSGEKTAGGAAAPSSTPLPPGTKLAQPDVKWGDAERTLLMVLSTNCRYCTESAPFYQRLAQTKARHERRRLVAVLPQDVGEARKYLEDNGVAVDEIKQATPAALGVRGTPTLIVVDAGGAVVQSWIGKLPPAKEVEVLNSFLVEAAGR